MTVNKANNTHDGNDDFVAELSTAVQEGKILCKWKVIYTEDTDDTESQKEMEEKGYTLPEYAFTVECDGVESEESGQLDIMGWIKTQFRDRRTGKLIANRKYTIYLSDDTIKKGTTDSDGFVYEKDLKHGEYYIEFGE